MIGNASLSGLRCSRALRRAVFETLKSLFMIAWLWVFTDLRRKWKVCFDGMGHVYARKRCQGIQGINFIPKHREV